MRRKMFISIGCLVGTIVLVTSFIIYAWYTNVNKTKSTDYVTDGLVLQYEINDSGIYNQEEFEVDDIVFFNVNASYEGKYFNAMAKIITLEITNYSHAYVDLNVKQNIQPYTLSATVSNNVITVYKYEKTAVSRNTAFSGEGALEYYSYTDASGYTKQTSYTSGITYFTRSVLGVSTLTIFNDSGVYKIKSVSSVDGASTPKALVSEVDVDGKSFNVGTYKEAPTGLTKAAFNVGEYYTLENGNYVLAKKYVAGTKYYEVNTLYYVGNVVLTETTVTSVGQVTTGAYVSCAITNTALDATIDSNISVSNYLNSKTVSNDYTHSARLKPATGVNDGTNATKGDTVTLYVYVYGIQPFDKASNNFLNNATNTYPFYLIISANQSTNQSAS